MSGESMSKGDYLDLGSCKIMLNLETGQIEPMCGGEWLTALGKSSRPMSKACGRSHSLVRTPHRRPSSRRSSIRRGWNGPRIPARWPRPCLRREGPPVAARTFSLRLSGDAARDLSRLLADHNLTFGAYWRWTQARVARLERENLALRAALREAMATRSPGA